MQLAKRSLHGRWGLAIGTFLVYMLITCSFGAWQKTGVIALLIGGPMILGAAIFSLAISRGRDARLEQIFDGFRLFGKALATYLLMILIIALWTLLLIVPGIIAALSYSMTFYALADNPALQPMEALNQSKRMMDGYKWKLFSLCMRFLVMALLCVFTLGIGLLWLIPYVNITMAEFYDDIRDR